ncbi:MAG TPA: MATE family efflux transporter [Bryobacteraceae bacterium]|nr:MATE family efflux transporter [Bryobacteraceae bacterium]
MLSHYICWSVVADVRSMLKIAIPLALAELGWMAMGVVDTIMVGRLPDSAVAIGGASVGGSLFYGFAIFGLGLLAGLDPFVSHAHGAGDPNTARRWLGGGVVLGLCCTPLIMGLILLAAPLLQVIGVQEEIRAGAIPFVKVLVWSVPPLMLYTVFRRYLQGLHRVRPVTFALISANLINLLGNWVLIYGHWGVPAMGLRGSALSTVFARIYMALFLFGAVLMVDREAFTQFRELRDGAWKLLRIGFPAALTIGFEVGVFNAVTAVIGKLGPVALAAHTIALNAAALTYMVPLGIGSAAAVSVGKALGAGDGREAGRAGWTAIGIGAVYEIGSALLFVLFPRQIASVYTTDERVISFSVTLLAIAAVFQLFDGLQTVASGALRGAGNTVVPMVWNLVAYWVIGFPGGLWLCFRWHWGAVGLWDGLCFSLILIGIGLVATWAKTASNIASLSSRLPSTVLRA